MLTMSLDAFETRMVKVVRDIRFGSFPQLCIASLPTSPSAPSKMELRQPEAALVRFCRISDAKILYNLTFQDGCPMWAEVHIMTDIGLVIKRVKFT